MAPLFFLQCRHKKQTETAANISCCSHSPPSSSSDVLLALVKLPHAATGDGFAGSPLDRNKFLSVDSKTAARRHQWTCALGANDNPERRGGNNEAFVSGEVNTQTVAIQTEATAKSHK